MITIIDYGMGNLRSVQKGFEHVGLQARVTDDPSIVASAEHLVLPGVGAFRDCMAHLREGGFVEPILRHVEAERPFLGICLGLQLLFTQSEEFGTHEGLGLVPGKVVRFPADLMAGGERLKVPHMGWNQVRFEGDSPLFAGIAHETSFYFVHSYYVVPDDAAACAATTGYGERFCSSIRQGNLMATQFHPEKSQQAGLQILKNFGEL